jgi:hypothetical protein
MAFDIKKTIKKIAKEKAAEFISGHIGAPPTGQQNIEMLEIEPIHTKVGGESIVLFIEPANLTVGNNVAISMSEVAGFYGRAEGIAEYKNTKRTMTVRFEMIKSHILNGPEAVSNNTITANLLQQLVYPAYTETAVQNTSVIKTPPYFRILYGDLIGDFRGGQRKGLTGYISSLSVNFASGRNTGENLTYGLNETNIPISYNVNMTFNVLHDHVVGWYDGKFAGDGRMNWPLNSGLVVDLTADGPGQIGMPPIGEPASDAPPEPFSTPNSTVAAATESGKAKLATKNNDNMVKGV